MGLVDGWGTSMCLLVGGWDPFVDLTVTRLSNAQIIKSDELSGQMAAWEPRWIERYMEHVRADSTLLMHSHPLLASVTHV